MAKTTDIKELRSGHGVFTWGKITEWFDVGQYAIAQYLDEHNEVGFHVWVSGVDTSTSYASLDSALAGAIAYRAEGPNHAADRYFIKSLVN
jgi:phosphosulfolactate phosphohydrolase-like enzyme